MLQLLSRRRFSADEMRSRGSELIKSGQVEAGLECFRNVMRREPGHRIALSELIRFLREHGRDDEARSWALAADASVFDGLLTQRYHDFSENERFVVAEIGSMVGGSPMAVASLMRAVQYVVRHNIRGTFLECGVWQGASVVAMIRALQEAGVADRDIYLFDTFEGMSEPESVDVMWHGERATDLWPVLRRPGTVGSDWTYCPIETVRWNVERTGYPKDRLHFVKGKVEDTLPEAAPAGIALLRLDTDFYASTKHELEHLYPRLARGGILIIDDYGAYRGSQLATDEYIARENLPLYLHRADENVRVAVKP
jgi:O-methyltransferase